MGGLMKRGISLGLIVTVVSCFGGMVYTRHCRNVRHQALLELEEFTFSLGGSYSTDLQDGGSWVYLDGVHITRAEARKFANICRKRPSGMGFMGVPIYLSLCNTKCDGPIAELVTEWVWYCSLNGQQLTKEDIQQIVSRAPNLAQLSLASTNVDDEMIGALRNADILALDVRETDVTARALCSLFADRDFPPSIRAEICEQDKATLKACGIVCSQ